MAIWRNKMTRLSAAGDGDTVKHSLSGMVSVAPMPVPSPATANLYFPQACSVQPDIGEELEVGAEVVVVLRGTVSSLSESQYADGDGSTSLGLNLYTCTVAMGE